MATRGVMAAVNQSVCWKYGRLATESAPWLPAGGARLAGWSGWGARSVIAAKDRQPIDTAEGETVSGGVSGNSFLVAQATGLYRPATRRAERGGRPEAMKMGLLKEAASIFRSARRQPARAGRPCYP